ncbi:hypothetical protein FO519_004166 [Halicephalobus sp. NKZ332]|nr:hypothetical protein FO519_004166 [Halicephalobus sp. NKZ332]
MRPAEEQANEFVADALECLKVKFINNVEEVNNKDPTYPIEFAYVKFGDLEKIYGYKDLGLTLCYTEATMFPHLVVEYSEEVKDKDAVPDDILAKMEIELVEDQKKSLRSLEVFHKKLEEQSRFQPFGTQIPHFIDEEKVGKKFALFRVEGELTEEEKLYLERIQSILFLFIEKAQYTDSDDNRFTYYVLYETFHQPGVTGTQYRLAGYMSYYKYYWHPDQWRLRNAHTFVFPQFRKIGLGSRFLHAINCDLRNMDKIYDTTAETPAPGYISARDYTSVLELIELPEFGKDKILNDVFSGEKAEVARQKWKMYKGAARRAHDILHLALAERKGTKELEEFKKLLVKRINKPYERKTKEYKRMELALSPEEMDLIVANHGDKLTDSQIVALRDSLIDQYRAIITRLENHSDKFVAYLK